MSAYLWMALLLLSRGCVCEHAAAGAESVVGEIAAAVRTRREFIERSRARRPPWLHHQHHRRLLQISIIVSSSVSNITIITIIYSTLASERVWKALTS